MSLPGTTYAPHEPVLLIQAHPQDRTPAFMTPVFLANTFGGPWQVHGQRMQQSRALCQDCPLLRLAARSLPVWRAYGCGDRLLGGPLEDFWTR